MWAKENEPKKENIKDLPRMNQVISLYNVFKKIKSLFHVVLVQTWVSLDLLFFCM